MSPERGPSSTRGLPIRHRPHCSPAPSFPWPSASCPANPAPRSKSLTPPTASAGWPDIGQTERPESTPMRTPLIALALLLSTTTLPAATPQLSAVRPVGGQRGTEVEVTLSGARLGDAVEVLHFQPGIETVSITKVDDNSVKA